MNTKHKELIFGFLLFTLVLIGISRLPAPSLPIFPSATDSPTPTYTPSITPTLSPLDTSTPTSTLMSTSLVPASEDLMVETHTEVIRCECNGDYGTVRIRIDFINGKPPFKISGQEPVNGFKAEFNVPLGSGDLNLILTSSDGKSREETVSIPSHCKPTDNCGNQTDPELPTTAPKLPTKAPTSIPTTPPIPQCRDGKDNDNDKKIDYPKDKGCSSLNDNSE